MVDQTDQNFSYVDQTKFKWKNNIGCYTDSNFAEKISSSSEANCEYLYKITTDVYGCLKCKPGKKGVVKNYMIPNCASHDSETLLCEYC